MNKPPNIPTIKLGDLRKRFEGYPDDYEVSFSGLTFSRVKPRGKKFLQIEFEEVVHRDENGDIVAFDL